MIEFPTKTFDATFASFIINDSFISLPCPIFTLLPIIVFGLIKTLVLISTLSPMITGPIIFVNESILTSLPINTSPSITTSSYSS
ncbi:MAG: hypothetical protein MJ244_01970 [Clostridia bacterium]|nr:hypothetical protein [Clostridia bacterium]